MGCEWLWKNARGRWCLFCKRGGEENLIKNEMKHDETIPKEFPISMFCHPKTEPGATRHHSRGRMFCFVATSGWNWTWCLCKDSRIALFLFLQICRNFGLYYMSWLDLVSNCSRYRSFFDGWIGGVLDISTSTVMTMISNRESLLTCFFLMFLSTRKPLIYGNGLSILSGTRQHFRRSIVSQHDELVSQLSAIWTAFPAVNVHPTCQVRVSTDFSNSMPEGTRVKNTASKNHIRHRANATSQMWGFYQNMR